MGNGETRARHNAGKCGGHDGLFQGQTCSPAGKTVGVETAFPSAGLPQMQKATWPPRSHPCSDSRHSVPGQ